MADTTNQQTPSGKQTPGEKPKPTVTAGRNVANGCQTCPLVAVHPCDVTKQHVLVHMLGDSLEDRSLGPLTKVRRNEPPVGNLEKSIHQYLRDYDQVIDAIASYPARDAAPEGYRQTPKEKNSHAKPTHSKGAKDVVRVEPSFAFMGTCEKHEHPLVSLKQLSNQASWILNKATGQYDRKIFQNIEKKGNAIGRIEFWANNITTDFGVNGGNLSVLFDVIRSLWPSHDPRLIEVRSTACGTRDQLQGNGSLRTLIRIFRKDTYQIGVKIPSLGKFSQEREGTLTGEKRSSVNTSYSAGFGLIQGSEKSQVSGSVGSGSYEHSAERTRWNHNGGSKYSHNESTRNALIGTTRRESSYQTSQSGGVRYMATTGNYTGETYSDSSELLDKLKRSSGFELIIRRNDREFTLAPDPNDKRSLKEKVVDGINKVIEGIQQAIEAINKRPQVGWSFTFGISILEGTLVGQWEPKSLSPTSSGRYHPVRHKVSLKIAMDIINLSLDLSFGIDVRALGSGIVVKIGLRGGLKVTVDKEWTFNIPRDEGYNQSNAIALKPESTIKGEAIGYASLAGWSLIDARLECTLTFNMPDGEIVVDDKGVHPRGTFCREPLYLRGQVVGFWGYKPMKPVLLCDGATIHKFG